jgi:hypothetical protein
VSALRILAASLALGQRQLLNTPDWGRLVTSAILGAPVGTVKGANTGSRGPDSDYDLLLVVPDSAAPPAAEVDSPTRSSGRPGEQPTSWFSRAVTSRVASTLRPHSRQQSRGRVDSSMSSDPVRIAETKSWP